MSTLTAALLLLCIFQATLILKLASLVREQSKAAKEALNVAKAWRARAQASSTIQAEAVRVANDLLKYYKRTKLL